MPVRPAGDVFPKLVEHKGEIPVIKDQLPAIFHLEGHPPGDVQKVVTDALAAYRATLRPSTQSVLFMAGEGDPLFLQIKEARASVLEPFAGRSLFPNHGQRVVNGYRMMQPASDMFLGWTQSPRRQFFIRQLRDIKMSPRVEVFGRVEMHIHATWCARALAISHARAGSSALLSGYMGKSDVFDQAIAAFSMAYADQNEKDHTALARAVKRGKVKAVFKEER